MVGAQPQDLFPVTDIEFDIPEDVDSEALEIFCSFVEMDKTDQEAFLRMVFGEK